MHKVEIKNMIMNGVSIREKKNIYIYIYIRKGEGDENMVLNLLRYHHRDK